LVERTAVGKRGRMRITVHNWKNDEKFGMLVFGWNAALLNAI
jgi:hypothetical protein